jgi:hypothetical protein
MKLSSIPGHGVRLLSMGAVVEPPQCFGDTVHISQGLAINAWQVEDGGISILLELGRETRGRVWLALPDTPKSPHLENRQSPGSTRGRVFIGPTWA